MFMLSLILMAAPVLPSPAQDAPAAVVPPDHADVEQQRRAVQVERDQRARYDAPPVEDYARTDAGLRPEDAQVILETAVFDPVLTADGLLTVSCDAGKVLLHLRSEGAGT